MCWAAHSWDRDERREDPVPVRNTVDDATRISDADRERVIEQLRTHTADGRLSLDEFAERVGEAWAATTHGELRPVLRDLPAPVVTREPSPRARRASGVPVPLLIAALVFVGSVLMSHFAWWLIPVGFWAFGGCGGHRARTVERTARRDPRRDDALISV